MSSIEFQIPDSSGLAVSHCLHPYPGYEICFSNHNELRFFVKNIFSLDFSFLYRLWLNFGLC